MRCLTKNLAMFGLGLYIYAGEDLPENVEETTTEPVKEEKKKVVKKATTKKEEVKVILIQESQRTLILEKFTADEIKAYLQEVNKPKLSELTIQEASSLLIRKQDVK